MQTYVQYRVCEGPLPSMKTLRASDSNPSCFFVCSHDHESAHVDTDDLLSFLETCGDTREKLQVLMFLSRHPKTRCTMDCLSCSQEARHLDVRRAVRELIHQGVIEEWTEDDVTLFALSNDQEKRNSVMNLGRLQWDQLRLWNDYRVVEIAREQVSS